MERCCIVIPSPPDIISAPDGKRGILELTKPVITVGRGNANDLVLKSALPKAG